MKNTFFTKDIYDNDIRLLNSASMRKLLIYVLILSGDIVFGQNSCDDKVLAGMEKQFNKADKRGKSDSYEYAQMAFDIAECYRHRNDTVASKWYRTNLRVTKSAVKGCDRNIPAARGFLHRMGLSYFYLEQYQDAEKHFNKSIAAGGGPESWYFLGKTLMHLNNWQEAKIEFVNCKRKSYVPEDLETLIKTCDDKITGK
jgi:tetratricopeptide (TPR) repeat protein